MSNFKKWRFWVALPIIMICTIYMIPILINEILKFVFSSLSNFTYWLDDRLEEGYHKVTPDYLDTKVRDLIKWVNK